MAINFGSKVALITGASSGIGAATAIYFAKLGAKLSLTGRNQDNLNETAQKCKEVSTNNQEPLVIAADLSLGSDTKTVMEKTIDHFQQLNVLVNNAGILELGGIENLSLESYDKQMNINTRSVFHMTQLAAPYLIKSKGNVVNISSAASSKTFVNGISYCMSKAATDHLTRCAAVELAPHQVRVNAVNPGVFKTDIHQRAGMTGDVYEQFMEKSKSQHALGRYGELDELASVIAFLASDNASFITGAVIPVDGGLHVM